MKFERALIIAQDEWRYWRRSRLGGASCFVAFLLIVASLVSTVTRVESERETRENFQVLAKQTFESQPARHPHRMIHYGHYVFRTPPPLSMIDPGIDAYAGTIMFLEGHRQNSAVFSPRYSGAQAGPLAQLSPAFTYQMLIPLALIILGFASITREREAKTDYLLFASSVTPTELWMGKTAALSVAALISLIPLCIGLSIAVSAGAGTSEALYLLLGYALYLIFWVILISAASALADRAASAFSTLASCWVLLCVVIPPLAGNLASASAPTQGRIASDLAVVHALHNAGDGHNANDPAFTRLRTQLLEQYDVEDVADLPINFRGVVAQASEREQGQILNLFANERMAGEKEQTLLVHWLGILSPTLAIKNFSVATSGTDLREHQHFQRKAEAIRYDFVQKLNSMHTQELSYRDDIQRSSDRAAEQRTRVSPSNWRILDNIRNPADHTLKDVVSTLPHLLILAVWSALLALIGLIVVRHVD